jgi:hypothetical protein
MAIDALHPLAVPKNPRTLKNLGRVGTFAAPPD